MPAESAEAEPTFFSCIAKHLEIVSSGTSVFASSAHFMSEETGDCLLSPARVSYLLRFPMSIVA